MCSVAHTITEAWGQVWLTSFPELKCLSCSTPLWRLAEGFELRLHSLFRRDLVTWWQGVGVTPTPATNSFLFKSWLTRCSQPEPTTEPRRSGAARGLCLCVFWSPPPRHHPLIYLKSASSVMKAFRIPLCGGLFSPSHKWLVPPLAIVFLRASFETMRPSSQRRWLMCHPRG